MAEINGKNKWIMYLVGVLVSLVFFVAIPTIAKCMIENDRRNVDSRSKIKSEMIKKDKVVRTELVEKIEKVEDIVIEIRIQQMEQMTILKRLDK